jgi:hypothetical protein
MFGYTLRAYFLQTNKLVNWLTSPFYTIDQIVCWQNDFLTKRDVAVGTSAASVCQQVAALVSVVFCSFYLVQNIQNF